MIDREQLADALGRLEPRDREILDYSLRRRVPDEDLSEIFGGAPGDVARLRASAVERLSTDLDVQRGSDLGHMLKELLEPATWELVPRSSEPARRPAGHRPVGAEDLPAGPSREVGTDAEPEPEPELVRAAEPEPVVAEPPPLPDAVAEPDPDRAPVLGMLSGRREQGGESQRRSGARRAAVAAAVGITLLVPAGVVAALSGTDPVEGGEDTESGARPFEPEPQAIGEPFPSDPKSAFQYPTAYLRDATVLYEEPGGKAKMRIAAKTEWDSPRVLGIVKREGSWLAVLAPELQNGEIGWIRDEDVDRLETVSWSVHTDLSQRRLVVRRSGKDVRDMKVGVGRTDHPTPTGRFAVTDKLRVSDAGSPYGCCVLALSGHQTRLPVGWPGGDRLAVHATRDTGGLGQAVSLGCLRVDPKEAQWMLDTVPLGTPVFIHG